MVTGQSSELTPKPLNVSREKERVLASQPLAYTPLVDLFPARHPLPGLPEASEAPADSDRLARLAAQAEASFRAARAGSTLRAYAHDWKQFRAWCDENRLAPLPASPQALILYSTDLVKNRHKKLNT